jgi:hypothetical protein
MKHGDLGAPTCEHASWDVRRAGCEAPTRKGCCPIGECAPKSAWIKASLGPIITCETKCWWSLYLDVPSSSANSAGSPDLVMLARVSQALARARAGPLAA